MVNFAGHIEPSITNGYPVDRAAFISEGLKYPVANGWIFESTPGVSTKTNNTPVSLQSRSVSGYLAGSYNDIFYNRILITPSNINVGILVAGQTYIIKVWNAYFTPVTLNTILEDSTNGLVITGPSFPTVYTPLLEQQYSLSLSEDGPSEIKAKFTFDFNAPTEDRSIKVIGSRLVILPYWFSSSSTETLSWLTDIIETRSGKEQRVRLRAAPRQQFSINAYAGVNEINRIENFLYGRRADKWGVPVWSEARQVSSPVSLGVNFIQVDTSNADFRVGENAMIWKSDRNFDVFKVDTFTSTQINIARGINDDYPVGIVVPVRFARMTSDPKRRGNGHSGNVSASFEVIVNKELTTINPVQYLGEDVDVGNTPLLPYSDSYQQKIIVHDYGTGTPSFFSPWDKPKINREYKLLLEGAEEIWIFRRWLHRRAGKAFPFYMPTYENNIRLIQESGSITSPLVAKDDQHHQLGIKRTHLAINTKSGWLFRSIIGQGLNAQGNNEIALNLPLNVDRKDIISISYMGLKRLSTDRVEINHLQNCVAEVTLPIVEIDS
jgi:hypothetical protein